LLGNRADLNIYTWEIIRSIQEEQPQSCKQYCGTETRTPTFFLCGTGTGMHCGSGTGYRPGSNMKCNTKVKKSKFRGQLSGNNADFSIKKIRFCTIFLLKNCAK